jgi:hypothetical protein
VVVVPELSRPQIRTPMLDLVYDEFGTKPFRYKSSRYRYIPFRYNDFSYKIRKSRSVQSKVQFGTNKRTMSVHQEEEGGEGEGRD